MAPDHVALFVTCLVDLLYPEVGEATVALLREGGVEVVFPESQTCCGQPPLNAGFEDDARRMARSLLDAFDEAEVVVTPSGSCAAMVRARYPHLFRGTRDEARARGLAAKTFELSEYLVDELGIESFGGRFAARATYHDACHLAHAQKVVSQPRALLAKVPVLKLVPLPESDMCCGAAGTYNLEHPQMATQLAERKLNHIAETGASVCVTGNVGCAMQIQSEGDARGRNVKVVHPVQVLHAAVFGPAGQG